MAANGSERGFGRIPAKTVGLFQRTIEVVRREVLAGLPKNAPPELRALTLQSVLEVVLRDWSENSNTSGLLPQDVDDLRNFVRLAVSLAGSDAGGAGLPVYETVLKGLLQDWLANWNSPGDPGPPGPG